MSDLVGNPEDWFSRVAAHIKVGYKGVYFLWPCFPDVILTSLLTLKLYLCSTSVVLMS